MCCPNLDNVLLFIFPPGIAIRPQEVEVGHGGHDGEDRDHEDEHQPELRSLVSLVSSPRPLDLRIFFSCDTSSFYCVVLPGKENCFHCRGRWGRRSEESSLPVISQKVDDSNDCWGPIQQQQEQPILTPVD